MTIPTSHITEVMEFNNELPQTEQLAQSRCSWWIQLIHPCQIHSFPVAQAPELFRYSERATGLDSQDICTSGEVHAAGRSVESPLNSPSAVWILFYYIPASSRIKSNYSDFLSYITIDLVRQGD